MLKALMVQWGRVDGLLLELGLLGYSGQVFKLCRAEHAEVLLSHLALHATHLKHSIQEKHKRARANYAISDNISARVCWISTHLSR